MTGAVLRVDWRPSDLLEDLHDGSLLGGWAHRALMPISAGVVFFLTGSGLYLWLAPIARRRRRRDAS